MIFLNQFRRLISIIKLSKNLYTRLQNLQTANNRNNKILLKILIKIRQLINKNKKKNSIIKKKKENRLATNKAALKNNPSPKSRSIEKNKKIRIKI